MFKVLVVDDDATLRMTVSAALGEADYEVDQAQDGEDAVNKVNARPYNLVVMDVNMPRMNGIEALKHIKAYDPTIIVIILTAFSNVKDAVAAIKEGAYNYLEKPIRADNLVAMVDRALKAHNMVKTVSYSAPRVKLPTGDFVGESNEMKKVFNVIEKLSRVETAVLIRGESGTGKELVAQAIHFNGPRKDEKFIPVNCSAIPETLMESEFFGHEKGAFTGADQRKIGKFQYADGGTLFLDEIGDIPVSMQVKLLRALQEKKFSPLGSNREVEVNVRVIAATNRPLEQMIKEGRFREDLFYRLNVLPIFLPSLRERVDDIAVLVNYFIEKFNVVHKKNIIGVSEDALNALKKHPWPGNIRELENVIEHAFVVESGDTIMLDSLPEAVKSASDSNRVVTSSMSMKGTVVNQTGTSTSGGSTTANPFASQSGSSGQSEDSVIVKFKDYQTTKEDFEKEFIVRALKANMGKINQTAREAGIPKKTLLRKIEKYAINPKEFYPKGVQVIKEDDEDEGDDSNE